MDPPSVGQFRLLGVPITATNMQSAIARVSTWIDRGDRGRMVTFSTVHMIVEGIKSPRFLDILQKADMNCPDGMPVVWYGRRRLGEVTEQVCGPEFLPSFCAATAKKRLRHYFYGGAEGVTAKAARVLKEKYPGIEIAGVYSPPFRPLTTDENDAVVCAINAAKPDVLWVCLGCPKQELWIEEFRGRLNVPVLLAVGQAVDIVAGTRDRAPRWMRNSGLEWFYRLCQEPRRLWRRYIVYNGIFLYRLLAQKVAMAGRSDAEIL